jgi:hypothetical protein
MDQQAAGAVQQHSNNNVREPSVAALRFALVLVTSECEQRPLYTPPQKLRRRIRTAFATVLHSRASILHEAPILHFELLNCTG